jgi:hypothetical protein
METEDCRSVGLPPCEQVKKEGGRKEEVER